MYRIVKSVCYTPETNITFYVSCTSIIKKKRKKEESNSGQYVSRFVHILSIELHFLKGYHLVELFSFLMTKHIHDNLFRYINNSFLIFGILVWKYSVFFPSCPFSTLALSFGRKSLVKRKKLG